MNVLFSSMEYDFHSLIKVAENLVTFPDVEKTEEMVQDYRARLRDLENNIWSH